MKKYLYPTLFSFFVLFLISFFCSYNYFSKENNLEVTAGVVNPALSSSKPIPKNMELTKKDDGEKNSSEKVNDGPANKIENTDKVLTMAQIDKPLYNKEVFLTIDDGPSLNNTLRNLKTLKENGVKATYFVIGKQAEELPDIIKALYDSGMSIENHTYSHNYNSYKSEEACLNDFARCDKLLEKILNKKASKFIRFPGGSDNQVSNREVMSKIRKDIVDKGLYYVDWNVSAGDAEPIRLDSKDIIKNTIEQCSAKNFAVVLMHEAEDKRNTADALDTVIKDLKSKGFIFRTFEDITPTEIKEMVKLRIIDRGF